MVRRVSGEGTAGDAGPHAQEELAAGDVQGPPVGAAEGAVGDQVLGHLDEVDELASRRDDVDPGAGVERLARVASAVQPGGHVEVPLDVDRHAGPAPAPGAGS